MDINEKNMEELKNIDIREVEAEDLVQLKSVKINPNDSREKRVEDYIKQIKNPYLFAEGKMVVKITYSENGVGIDECIANYLKGV